MVGCAEGAKVGKKVGGLVGRTVGERVGILVGVRVGAGEAKALWLGSPRRTATRASAAQSTKRTETAITPAELRAN